jgi:multimeric flavodoxin WrbA
MLASPVFFYTVSAHTKIFMDRFQSLWVKKYWVEPSAKQARVKRKALLIAAGATKGRKLFDGILLTMRYFFDVLDMELWEALLYRQLDFEDDVLKHPDYLQQAYRKGREMVGALVAQKTS